MVKGSAWAVPVLAAAAAAPSAAASDGGQPADPAWFRVARTGVAPPGGGGGLWSEGTGPWQGTSNLAPGLRFGGDTEAKQYTLAFKPAEGNTVTAAQITASQFFHTFPGQVSVAAVTESGGWFYIVLNVPAALGGATQGITFRRGAIVSGEYLIDGASFSLDVPAATPTAATGTLLAQSTTAPP